MFEGVALCGAFRVQRDGLNATGSNPVLELERSERPKSDDKAKRILSGDELERVLRAVPARHRLIFEFAAETGARLAEALGVAFEDVDLDDAAVTFTHQLDRKGNRVELKTGRSRRCIEITPALVAKLRAHRMASKRSKGHDLVFCTSTGRGHDHRNIGGRVLARAVTKAGLEAIVEGGRIVVEAPTFHSLRHTHASALIAQGWDIEEVSARLGHANVATTQRIYVHAYEAAKRSEGRRSRLVSLYGGLTETETTGGLIDPADGSGEGSNVVAMPHV